MPLLVPVEIRFADIDKLSHVNNAVYLSYFEQARLLYLSKVIGTGIDWSETGIILARAEIDFISPLYLEDTLKVEISCTRIGTKSFDLSYRALKEKNNEKIISARGTTVLVCFNYKNSQTIPVPSNWIDKIKLFEENL